MQAIEHFAVNFLASLEGLEPSPLILETKGWKIYETLTSYASFKDNCKALYLQTRKLWLRGLQRTQQKKLLLPGVNLTELKSSERNKIRL